MLYPSLPLTLAAAGLVTAAFGSQLCRLGYWVPQNLEYQWELESHSAAHPSAVEPPAPAFVTPDLKTRLLHGVVSAVLGSMAVWQFGPTVQALGATVFLLFLQVMSLSDIRNKLLPDFFTYPLLWLGLLLAATAALFTTPEQAILGAAVGFLSMAVPNWVYLAVTGKEGVGGGDAKLLAGVGAWLGPMAVLDAVSAGTILGLLVPLVAIARKKDPSGAFAFGPFLALGAAGSVFGVTLVSLVQWVRWG